MNGHMTFIQRRINVDASSWRCIDVDATFYSTLRLQWFQMNAEEFRKYGRQMVDYIADYMENIREREVVHRVSPGYLRELLPKEAPDSPEDFDEVFKDVEKYIMPGVSTKR